jgi:NTE family protein
VAPASQCSSKYCLVKAANILEFLIEYPILVPLKSIMKLGVVISGGAAKSISSLGALDALREMGLNPTVFSGVSGGAVVAVFYAAGFSPLEQLDMVMNAGMRTFLKPTTRRGGFFNMDGAITLYRSYLGDKTFEDLPMPVTINATDYKTGEPVYFNSGEIVEPLVASTSIPGIFVPVAYDDYLLLDGAVTDNLPVSPLVGNCDFILGIQTPGTAFNPNKYSVKSVAFRTSQLMQFYNAKLRAKDCDFLIHVQGLDGFGMFDLKKAKQIYKAGYDYTVTQADALLAKVKEIQDKS